MKLCRKSCRELFSMEEVNEVKVQKSSVRCNSDSIESDATMRRLEVDWRDLVRAKEFIKRKVKDIFETSCMCGTTPDMGGVLHAGANNTHIKSKQLGWS